jgi:N6-adenosine-specific RNA methylase IME4
VSRYRTIVADPPWPIPWAGGGRVRVNGRGERRTNQKFRSGLPYERISIEDICALPVAKMAEDDAHLYLWITARLAWQGVGVRVAEAWGFEVVNEIIWAKRNYGLGVFPRPQHEPLLVCRRGKLPFRVRNAGSIQSWDHPRDHRGSKIHSAKPDAAIDLIEQASPGPYVELFARRARFGWDYWGDQSLGTAQLDAA